MTVMVHHDWMSARQTTPSKMNFGMNEDLKIAAETIKQAFDEFVKAGFEEEQALELCKAIIQRKSE